MSVVAGDQMARALDPVDLEVLLGRLQVVADEMEMTLFKTAYSTTVKEGLDATAALFDRNGRTMSQADALPAHLGMMVEAIRRVVSEYPEGVARPGDVYIFNDPYDGASHLPDINVAMPVFVDERLVGYSATMCHHQDVGGASPGSTPPTAVDLHAEGLVIPLMKLAAEGVMNETIIRMLRSNSRLPAACQGDLEAQLAACNTGVNGLTEVCREWGADRLLAAVDELMDYAERRTRLEIEAMPDGVYEYTDFLDDDGVTPDPVKIQVTVSIEGSDLHFDFTGTAPQVRGALNCVPSSTMAAVYFVMRALTDPTIPNNDGCYRPISATLPVGTIVNPTYPAPVGCRATTFKRLVDVSMGALAKAVPERVPAASNGQINVMWIGGFDANAERFYVSSLGVPVSGGMGARPTKDGIDVIDCDLTNTFLVPMEASETEMPVLMRSLGLWRDSGGAGKYRGGLGYVAEVEWLGDDALLTVRRDRHKFGPWGLAEGLSAPLCRTIVKRVDGTEEELPSKGLVEIHRGDVVQTWTTGGGGYGPPLERDPRAVYEDVINDRVSREAAHDVYGVVIKDGRLDTTATTLLRARMEAAETRQSVDN